MTNKLATPIFVLGAPRNGQDIINLTRLGTDDGGSQTACSFLKELSQQRDPKDYCVAAFKDTAAGRLAENLGFDKILIGRNARERVHLDLSCRRLFRKGQLCFTFHGAPWYRSKGYLVNMSGVADSNLFYPNIPFWRHRSIPQQAMLYVKDRGRMYGYSRADYWLFETEVLSERAVALGGYPRERVATVKMSASVFVSPDKVSQPLRDGFKQRIGDGFSLLFLAGPNPNKRIVNIAASVAEIRGKRLTDTPIKVVTTLNPASGYFRTIEREFCRLGVKDAWVNLGPVPYDSVSSLIDACDVVCLFSVLESFSSNFTEAWAMRKPLLVTDADWARSACGNAAVYVSPEDVLQVADAVVRLTRPAERAKLLEQYAAHFNTYPTATQRCAQYLQCMESARKLGSISAADCKTVRKCTSRKIF